MCNTEYNNYLMIWRYILKLEIIYNWMEDIENDATLWNVEDVAVGKNSLNFTLTFPVQKKKKKGSFCRVKTRSLGKRKADNIPNGRVITKSSRILAEKQPSVSFKEQSRQRANPFLATQIREKCYLCCRCQTPWITPMLEYCTLP